ncbi:serine/threonine protein phosphatase [Epibacterium sp. SM1979]|uniref:Serine/threonine protein phosphatase n=1 Tax=Tritonibacter litoralis TaxID=2662264 RepID=A0A843YFD0_9RHOB|nr:metallophosphoesterase family protein [Tritonibacter litoralis]MQQ07799.1 serine/threonine protein phosphatase [Tritonibacter litoralis]
MTQPIYAIGDIHGQHEMLKAALARIEADGGQDARVVFLGDYTDRGPGSPEVLDLLIEGRDQGRDWHFLLGNHDQMFAMFMEDYPRNDARLLVGYDWLHPRIGGRSTLACYGIEIEEGARTYEVHARAKEAIPKAHVDFLNQLKHSHCEEGLLFVHAGIRPGVELVDQDPDDLIWIRDEFLEDTRDHGRLVVHGHTHIDAPTHYGNRINLDSGAGYGHPLTAAVFEGQECSILTSEGRKRLLPG